MPALTRFRAQLLCAVVAGMVYVGVLGHDWAGDDVPIIATNVAAHSISGATSAFFSPYWPGDVTISGQHRPLVMLSYAVDWTLSNGTPAWFHFVNLLIHAGATVLFVSVALAWLPLPGATVAGLTFAVHPVHVEAVANVVGRAEVLVALGVFACMLAARHYRTAVTPRARAGWLSVVLVSLLASLFVKEHAVIVVAVVLLDELLDSNGNPRRSAMLYASILAVTFGWLYLWTAIAGQFVSLAEAATIRGLSTGERLATMFPAQLDVVRLLVFPLDLAADYNPQVIPRRTEWSTLATTGLLTTTAIVTLGVAVWRKAPAIAFGILFAIMSYAPTSNLVFSSGIVLAERNLYLAVVATAMVIGWLFSHSFETIPGRSGLRALVVGSIATLLVVYAVRTVTRVPFWRDSDNVLLMDYAEHSENYRARLRLGRFYRNAGNLPAALTEAITAGAIFPEDPWVAQYSVVRALDLGLPDVAFAEAQRAYNIEPTHASFARLVVRARFAQGELDSAAAVARRSIVAAPDSPIAMWTYTQVLDSLGASRWQRHLAQARFDFLEGRLGNASARIDSGLATVPPDLARPPECWELTQTIPVLRALKPDAADTFQLLLRSATPECRSFSAGGLRAP